MRLRFNNFIYGNYLDRPIHKVGASTKVYNNLGYVTENILFSISNTTATTFVFNTGLASTANSVFCTFDSTTACAIKSYSWTSTTTQVTVTVYVEEGLSLPAEMTILAVELRYIP